MRIGTKYGRNQEKCGINGASNSKEKKASMAAQLEKKLAD